MPTHATIDIPLLHLLLESRRPMTIEAIALRRGVSRSRCLHEMDRLRRAGCVFAEHPQHGLELIASGLGAWVDYLEPLAKGRVVLYGRTTSTQDVARQLGPTADGAYVIADHQTGGRGRLGRAWSAPAGTAVLLSRVHTLDARQGKGDAGGGEVDRLTFAASSAVARAADAFLGEGRAGIKWPNDIVVDGRKLAGILVEITNQTAVIGVGFNVGLTAEQLPAALGSKATSLAMLHIEADRLRVLGELIAALDEVLTNDDPAALLTDWRSRCVMLHEAARFRSDGREVRGMVIDLDPREGLIVRTTTGPIVHLHAATTTVLD